MNQAIQVLASSSLQPRAAVSPRNFCRKWQPADRTEGTKATNLRVSEKGLGKLQGQRGRECTVQEGRMGRSRASPNFVSTIPVGQSSLQTCPSESPRAAQGAPGTCPDSLQAQLQPSRLREKDSQCLGPRRSPLH